jgi:hypothetical protein
VRKRQLSLLAQLYLVSVAGLAVIAALVLWRASRQSGSPVALLLVAAAGAISHAFPIEGRNHETYHATLPFVIVAAAPIGAGTSRSSTPRDTSWPPRWPA